MFVEDKTTLCRVFIGHIKDYMKLVNLFFAEAKLAAILAFFLGG